MIQGMEWRWASQQLSYRLFRVETEEMNMPTVISVYQQRKYHGLVSVYMLLLSSVIWVIIMKFVNISGSINLLCVPIGCVFSGLFTESLGKRRAMQVSAVPWLWPSLECWMIISKNFSLDYKYSDDLGMATLLLRFKNRASVSWPMLGWSLGRSNGSTGKHFRWDYKLYFYFKKITFLLL